MAQLPAVFNAESHKGRMGFNVIPAGTYKSKIVKSESKKTKAGDGTIYTLHEKITEGEFKGNVIFARLNLVNKNDQAVQIAQNELGTICDACGKKQVKETEELHGIEHYIDVGIKPADDNYPEGNVIKGYRSLNDKVKSSVKADDTEEVPKRRAVFGNKGK